MRCFRFDLMAADHPNLSAMQFNAMAAAAAALPQVTHDPRGEEILEGDRNDVEGRISAEARPADGGLGVLAEILKLLVNTQPTTLVEAPTL